MNAKFSSCKQTVGMNRRMHKSCWVTRKYDASDESSSSDEDSSCIRLTLGLDHEPILSYCWDNSLLIRLHRFPRSSKYRGIKMKTQPLLHPVPWLHVACWHKIPAASNARSWLAHYFLSILPGVSHTHNFWSAEHTVMNEGFFSHSLDEICSSVRWFADKPQSKAGLRPSILDQKSTQ